MKYDLPLLIPLLLHKRFPVKYSRDGDNVKQLGEIVKELRNLIDNEADSDRLADYIDEEFLFGAWGHICKDLDYTFLADLRGLIVAMYRDKMIQLETKKRGSKNADRKSYRTEC